VLTSALETTTQFNHTAASQPPPTLNYPTLLNHHARTDKLTTALGKALERPHAITTPFNYNPRAIHKWVQALPKIFSDICERTYNAAGYTGQPSAAITNGLAHEYWLTIAQLAGDVPGITSAAQALKTILATTLVDNPIEALARLHADTNPTKPTDLWAAIAGEHRDLLSSAIAAAPSPNTIARDVTTILHQIGQSALLQTPINTEQAVSTYTASIYIDISRAIALRSDARLITTSIDTQTLFGRPLHTLADYIDRIRDSQAAQPPHHFRAPNKTPVDPNLFPAKPATLAIATTAATAAPLRPPKNPPATPINITTVTVTETRLDGKGAFFKTSYKGQPIKGSIFNDNWPGLQPLVPNQTLTGTLYESHAGKFTLRPTSAQVNAITGAHPRRSSRPSRPRTNFDGTTVNQTATPIASTAASTPPIQATTPTAATPVTTTTLTSTPAPLPPTTTPTTTPAPVIPPPPPAPTMTPTFQLQLHAPNQPPRNIIVIPDSAFLTDSADGHLILNDATSHYISNPRKPDIRHFTADDTHQLPLSKMGDITLFFPDGSTVGTKAYIRPLPAGIDALISFRLIMHIARLTGNHNGTFAIEDGKGITIAGIHYPFTPTLPIPTGTAISNHMNDQPPPTDDPDFINFSAYSAFSAGFGSNFVYMISTAPPPAAAHLPEPPMPTIADYTNSTTPLPSQSRRHPRHELPTAWPAHQPTPPAAQGLPIHTIPMSNPNYRPDFDCDEEGPHEAFELDTLSGQIEYISHVNTQPHQHTELTREEVADILRQAGFDASDTAPAGTAKTAPVPLHFKNNETPIYRRQHFLSARDREAADPIFKHMLATNAIEYIPPGEDDSKWNHSWFITYRSKNGKIKARLVFNLVEINKQLQPSRFELPPMHEQLQKIAGPPGKLGDTFYATLDIVAMYNAILINDHDRNKLAFTHDGRRMRHRTVPFGLVHGGDEATRSLHIATESVRDLATFIVDDGALSAPSMPELVNNCIAVLIALREGGFHPGFSKLRIGMTELEDHCGSRITPGCISVPTARASTLAHYPQPSTPTQLTTFIGQAGFYAPHIPQFAIIAQPMRDLLTEHANTARNAGKPQPRTLTWNPNAAQSFERIRAAMANTSTLATFDANKLLIMFCDASNTSIVVSLFQDGRSLGHNSKTLTVPQTKYSIYDKETLAALYGLVRHWSLFMRAKQSIIYTDHESLTYGLSTATPHTAGRLARTANIISMSGAELAHISGKRNPADITTRIDLTLIDRNQIAALKLQHHRATPDTGSASLHFISTFPPRTSDEKSFQPMPRQWFMQITESTYREDPTIDALWPHLTATREATTPPTLTGDSRYWARLLSLDTDDRIWYNDPSGAQLLVIPRGDLANQLLTAIHVGLAHPSSRNMADIVSSRYFIFDLIKNCHAICYNCIPCAQSHPLTVQRGLHSSTLPANAPFEVIHIDIMTGFADPSQAVLSITDQLTGMRIYSLCKTTSTSAELWERLNHDVFQHYGTPRIIFSDNARNLISRAIEKLAAENDIQLLQASVEHHAATSEAANRAFRGKLRILSDREGKGLETLAPDIQFSLNITPGPSGKSAFEKYLGYNPRHPLLGPVTLSSPLSSDQTATAATWHRPSHSTLRQIHHEQRANTAHEHDKGRVNHHLKVGDLVAIPTHLARVDSAKFNNAIGAKAFPLFLAPFSISSIDSHDNATINLGNGKTVILHVSIIKPLPPSINTLPDDPAQPKSLLWPNDNPKVRYVDGRRSFHNKPQYLIHYWGQLDVRARWTSPHDVDKRDRHLLKAYDARQLTGQPSFPPRRKFFLRRGFVNTSTT
jgi:hypothetical protein